MLRLPQECNVYLTSRKSTWRVRSLLDECHVYLASAKSTWWGLSLLSSANSTWWVLILPHECVALTRQIFFKNMLVLVSLKSRDALLEWMRVISLPYKCYFYPTSVRLPHESNAHLRSAKSTWRVLLNTKFESWNLFAISFLINNFLYNSLNNHS